MAAFQKSFLRHEDPIRLRRESYSMNYWDEETTQAFYRYLNIRDDTINVISAQLFMEEILI